MQSWFRPAKKPSKPDLTTFDNVGIVENFSREFYNLWFKYGIKRFRSIPSTIKTVVAMLVVGSIVNRSLSIQCVEIGSHSYDECFWSHENDGSVADADMLGDFVVATACSHGYFHQLENLIGSIHVWEPKQKIIVYDIGMSHEQLAMLNCYVNVSVIPFPFDTQPDHVANLYNYAWKILILDDALQRHDAVLMLDSGVELRAPLREIKQIIANTGHFSVIQPGTVSEFTHPNTFNYLGVDVGAMDHYSTWGVPFYAGGIQGFRTESIAYGAVLAKAVKCARDESCIHPEGAGRDNHNYDQSVLSILLRLNGFIYDGETAERFASFQSFRWTLDETHCDDEHVLVLRKHQWNKVYRKHLRKRAFCSRHPPPVESPVDSKKVVESSLNRRLSGNSSLLMCLKKNHNNRVACKEFLDEGPVEWLLHAYLIQSGGYALLNSARALMFCPVTCFVCAAVSVLSCIGVVALSRTIWRWAFPCY